MQEERYAVNQADITPVSQQWGTARLRLLFLAPMSIAIAVVVFVFSMTLNEHASRDVEKGVFHVSASVQDFYEESVRYDAKALQAIIHTLRQDDALAAALAKSSREDLLRRAAPLFENIRQDFAITHLYFTGVDRVNLLRVHTPLRYGDVIDRITMVQAQKSGSIAYGVELGPLGTFTLRVVAPWYDEKTYKLIGYVELGMEIDQVVDKLQNFFDVQVFALVKKEFLDRKKWESGMRALGRTPHWDRFADKVESEQSQDKVPSHLAEYLTRGEPIPQNSIINLAHHNLSYRATSLPLLDAGGREVAEMVVIADVSEEEEDARHIVYTGTVAALVTGGILFVFFYWLVGLIGRRIENNEEKLRDMATHDGLTGLYSHKFFYAKLEDELPRADRYQHRVSLLLLDIDHFKNVNDTYGHRSGDMILRSLSERLVSRTRSTDWVCRYGGEEITILLPETEDDIAKQIAEDLRILIEHDSFEIEDGQYISITVSIGVNTYPRYAKDAAALVSGADAALYEAKASGRNRVCIYESK